MPSVMDACALIALLREERGADEVREILAGEDGICMVHAINLCEVYYDFYRSYNERAAERAIEDLADVGLICREDLDGNFWRSVGRLKAGPLRLSLADCHAIALAQRENLDLVTTDHAEFDPVATNGICRVRFVR